MSRKWVLTVAVLAALSVVLLAVVYKRQPQAIDVTFIQLDGRATHLSALKDKVVLVNFWATSCPTCIEEMPELKKLYATYQSRGVELMAVAMSHDTLEYVQAYVTNNAIPFPVAFDQDGAVARAFDDVQLTPTTIMIGRDGRLLKRYLGVPDFAVLRQELDRALAAA